MADSVRQQVFGDLLVGDEFYHDDEVTGTVPDRVYVKTAQNSVGNSTCVFGQGRGATVQWADTHKATKCDVKKEILV